MNLERLYIVVTTLFLSFVLISCNDDKIGNKAQESLSARGACTIKGKDLKNGEPTTNEITVSCTENVTKNICQGLEKGAISSYRNEVRVKAGEKAGEKAEENISKKDLPEGKFSANADCPTTPKRLASCTTGEVVTYVYDFGDANLNAQLKGRLETSCTAPSVYKEL